MPSYGLDGSFSVGAANQIVAADVNNDGHLDFITASRDSNGTGKVAVLLATPKGKTSYTVAHKYAVAHGAGSLTVGDFNGDGKIDVVTGNSSGLSVLLGNGDGTFHASKDFSLPLGSYLAVGDLNGDGKLDLVTNYPSGVTVYLGNGDGNFQAGATYTSLGAAAAVGDFNADGKLDVVTSSDSALTLLAGNGDGTFRAVQTIDFGYGTSIEGVAVGDFNGDGTPDLGIATFYWGPGSADRWLQGAVLLGGSGGLNSTGYGTFYAINSDSIVGLAAADVNGDGKVDLLAMNQYGIVDILAGNGDGTLGVDHNYWTVGAPGTFVVGDFNRDGSADLAALVGGSTVDVFLWSSRQPSW